MAVFKSTDPPNAKSRLQVKFSTFFLGFHILQLLQADLCLFRFMTNDANNTNRPQTQTDT